MNPFDESTNPYGSPNPRGRKTMGRDDRDRIYSDLEAPALFYPNNNNNRHHSDTSSSEIGGEGGRFA